MDVELGAFIVPDAEDPVATVSAIVAADRSGLDAVGIQDHPYQRRFFDTWTLLSFAAARTSRVRLLPDVVNLPLRLPSVLGFRTLLVAVPTTDPVAYVTRLGEEVAPRVRVLVATA